MMFQHQNLKKRKVLTMMRKQHNNNNNQCMTYQNACHVNGQVDLVPALGVLETTQRSCNHRLLNKSIFRQGQGVQGAPRLFLRRGLAPKFGCRQGWLIWDSLVRMLLKSVSIRLFFKQLKHFLCCLTYFLY